jgi:hypothetical protein
VLLVLKPLGEITGEDFRWARNVAEKHLKNRNRKQAIEQVVKEEQG